MLDSEEEALQFEPQKVVAQGDTVACFGLYKSRLRRNGAIVQTEWAHRFTLRDGLVSRWQQYADNLPYAEAYGKPATAGASKN